MRRRALAAPLLATALALAGCGTSSAAGTGGVATPTTAATMPAMSMPAGSMPAGSIPAAVTAVGIEGFAFAPATITVKVGATVTWTNKDEDPHTVTARDKGFASATLATGQTFSHTFSTPGSYPYLCTIHPFMTATVVVTP